MQWILVLNGPEDRCCGSWYSIGRRIDAVDPGTQWARGYVLWILVLNRPEDRCSGSWYSMGPRIGAVDPGTHWARG